MKTFGITALAVIAALVLGFGARLGSVGTAHADVSGTAAIGCEFLAAGINGSTTDATTAADVTAACDGLSTADIANLALALGDKTAPLTLSDLASVDLDANQVTKAGTLGGNGSLYLFAFVNNEGPVTFDAQTGVTTALSDGTAFTTPEVCDTEAQDADCSAATPGNGDGVVVARVDVGTAAVDMAVNVNISQNPSGTISTEAVNVVGTPQIVTLTVVKTTLQSSGTATAATACTTDADVRDTSTLDAPNSTVAIASVTDPGGTKLARVPVGITTSNATAAAIGINTPATGVIGNTGVTVDGGTAGIGAFATICGGSGTGTSTLTAKINAGLANEDTSTATITTVGVPAAVALTAAPTAVDCAGGAGSTVTATVTDGSGNKVADNTAVTFSVVALGTANPINAKTTAGVATSTITALSGSTAGVTVVVSAGTAAQASIRVDCLPSLAQPTTPAGGATATPVGGTGTITGPNTGTGGYLGQDDSTGFPMWAVVALALASTVMVAGGLVTRRAGK